MKKCPGFTKGKLESIIKYSLCCKGRLLHYFPKEMPHEPKTEYHDDVDFSDWCGWHNDHVRQIYLIFFFIFSFFIEYKIFNKYIFYFLIAQKSLFS